MAEKYNLIPAAELPTTEADEVDVLCVEGGELKRKPAANLSGGGGGYVIHVPADEITRDENDGSATVMLSESYDNFAPVIEKGGTVYLDMTADPAVAEMGALLIYSPIMTVVFAPDMGGFIMMAFDIATGGMIQVIASNGTWTPTASTGEAEA